MSEVSGRGWDRWLTDERVTLSAVLEAIGLELVDGHSPLSSRVARRAAEIDKDRKSRR